MSQTYMREALRAYSNQFSQAVPHDLIFAALGLTAEFRALDTVLHEDNPQAIHHQLGRLAWYMAVASQALGIDPFVAKRRPPAEQATLEGLIGQFVSLVRDGYSGHQVLDTDMLTAVTGDLVDTLAYICYGLDTTLDMVLDADLDERDTRRPRPQPDDNGGEVIDVSRIEAGSRVVSGVLTAIHRARHENRPLEKLPVSQQDYDDAVTYLRHCGVVVYPAAGNEPLTINGVTLEVQA